MPLINFNSPVVEKDENIQDRNVIQVDVNNDFDSRQEKKEKSDSLKAEEEYLSLKESELNAREKLLKAKEEKIKLIIRAMIEKDEEIKNREMYLINYIDKK